MIRALPAAVLAALLLLLPTLLATPALADGKLQIYLLRMEPTNTDAKDFSRECWGGGVNAVFPVPAVHNLFAGVAGVDVANMLSETIEFRDYLTGLRVEQQTSQTYVRIYLGGRVGPHGSGFVRPHLGTNLAVVMYSIGTDVVIPDDTDRQNEIRQNLRDESEAVFGWDFTAGCDFNIVNRFPIEAGVRFMKSFNVPQQLGAGAVSVEPAYVQLYLGVGMSFRAMKEAGKD